MKSSLRLLAAVALGAGALALGIGNTRPAIAIEGVIQNPANGHWYKWISGPVTWQTAKGNAAALRGYLATVTSAAEDAWIVANFTVGATWLGATDEVTEGVWVWITGETWSFTKWQSGEPNNGGGSEDYLEYQAGRTDWNDAPPNDPDGYLVEWDQDPNTDPPDVPPAAPSNLIASVSYGNPILLRWKDNSGNEETFEVERATAGTAFARVVELGPNSTTYEDFATAPQVEYTYRVRARNTGGTSDYSNEASVTSSSVAPAPRAPTDLVVVSASSTAVGVRWTDNSFDEIGFELHRRSPGGEFEFVATVPANSWSFTHEGLVPDGQWVYGVRAVSAFRTSGFCECEAATLPTLQVTALRADLKDSPKFGKDSMKVQALFDFLPASPDGLFDPLAEGITLRAGDDAHPVVMTLPGGLDTWKFKGTKATWKSPKGSMPKYMIQVDLEDRLLKASATGLELAAPPANPMRVSVGIGNDAGTARGDWEAKKPGYFRLR